MKLFLLGVVAGLILHKTANFYYDYEFNDAFNSEKCKSITAGENGTLSDRFKCTYKVMGFRDYVKYILIRPAAPNGFDKDSWTF